MSQDILIIKKEQKVWASISHIKTLSQSQRKQECKIPERSAIKIKNLCYDDHHMVWALLVPLTDNKLTGQSRHDRYPNWFKSMFEFWPKLIILNIRFKIDSWKFNYKDYSIQNLRINNEKLLRIYFDQLCINWTIKVSTDFMV